MTNEKNEKNVKIELNDEDLDNVAGGIKVEAGNGAGANGSEKASYEKNVDQGKGRSAEKLVLRKTEKAAAKEITKVASKELSVKEVSEKMLD